MNPINKNILISKFLTIVAFLLFSVSVNAQEVTHFTKLASYSGDENLFNASNIEEESETLDSLVFAMKGSHSLKITGVDLLPLGGFFQEDGGNQKAYNDYLDVLQQGTGEFIAFFVDYDDKGKRIPSFEFSMPRGGSFDTIPEINRTAIENKLRTTFQLYASTQIDYAVYQTLKHCIRLFSGEEEIRFDLEELEFTKLSHLETIDLPELTQGAVSSPASQNQIGIYDYSGLYINGVSIGTAIANVSTFQSYSTAVYVSSNHSITTTELVNDVAGSFGQQSEVYSLWLFVEWTSANEYQIWAKGNTNHSEDQAHEELVQYFDAGFNANLLSAKEDPALSGKSNGTPLECVGKVNTVGELASEVVKFPLGKWSHGKDWTAYCIGAEKYHDGITFNPFENLQQTHDGFIAGLLDGLAGTISVIYLVSNGYNEVKKHIPFTFEWIVDIVKKTIEYSDLKKAWKMNFQEAKDLFKSFEEMIKLLAGNLHCVLEDIKALFVQTLNKLNPATGLYSTAYIHGLIAFEIVIEVLTGGAAMANKLTQLGAGVSKLGTKIAGLGKGAATKILKPKEWHDHIGTFFNRYKNPTTYKLTPEVVSCLSSVGKCFIGGTLVAMANGPLSAKPIELIQPMDMVESRVESNASDQTVFEKIKSSPLVSAEQIYYDEFVDLEKDIWLVGEFSANDEELALNIVRPKAWFENLGATAIGEVALIQLPEMGIAHRFTLNKLAPISSSAQKQLTTVGTKQPVTATIKRTAPLILGLILADDTIGVTPEHRVFSYDRQEYVPAGELLPSEFLETQVGKVQLTSIDTLSESETTVYNLEVRRNHNFYVGEDQVLVHNEYSRDFIEKVRELNSGPSPRIVHKKDIDGNDILKPDGTPEVDDFSTFIANLDEGRLNQFYTELNIKPLGVVDNNVLLVRAWEVLFIRNVPKALRSNVPFLTRLAKNNNLVNFVDNLTDYGRVSLGQNIDEWVKFYDVRTPLKSGNTSHAIDLLEGTLGSPTPLGYISSGGVADNMYVLISNTPSQINPVARNLAEHISSSISPPQELIDRMTQIVTDARKHLFIDNHLVEVGNGRYIKGRFTPRADIAEKWNAVANNAFDFEDAEGLITLIRHEYIESKLMREGVVYSRYSSGTGPTTFRYGAHELSPLDYLEPNGSQAPQFVNHWGAMERSFVPSSILPDFSNIDLVVEEIKIIEAL